MKPIKIQRDIFAPPEKELTQREYERLVRAAERRDNGRLSLVIQTICAVFVTRGGKPLNRSNIWRMMKSLYHEARVSPSKIFPHNLRHLFARIYYKIEKDISCLADILGHSSMDTTRIYTMETGRKHMRQLDRMKLICARE